MIYYRHKNTNRGEKDMFYKNPLAYIQSKIDKENNLVMVEQVNNYRYPSENFIKEINTRRENLEDELEIFCVLGNTEEIKKIQEDISDRIRKFFEKIQEDNLEYLIENLQKEVENAENSTTQRFFDLYISTIIENEKLKYPRMYVLESSNGVFCLGFYLTNSPQEEKIEEVESSMITYLQKEKPFYMGKQIMIQSFLLEDIKDRKILAVMPNDNGEWYALLEGGIKLYLSNESPYQREKMTSEDIGRWTVLELESILNNPCYTYQKMFEPYALFEEWNNVFLYALATLPIKYEAKTLELLYSDFL